jgi:hypothetical protein
VLLLVFISLYLLVHLALLGVGACEIKNFIFFIWLLLHFIPLALPRLDRVNQEHSD